MDTDTSRRINELFTKLGDRLDPTYGQRIVPRAWAMAQNSMAAKGGPSSALAALAAELRAAADEAEEIARLTS